MTVYRITSDENVIRVVSKDVTNIIKVSTRSPQTFRVVTNGRGPQGLAGAGVPTGGTVGQILSKIDETNYNTEWIDQSGGGAVDSVNSQTGNVVLDQDDIGDGTNYKQYSAIEKTKLAGIQAGAEVNTVDSVAGKTGAVSLVKADVGLSNVDNTSDANKPISTATQTALNLKADSSALAGYQPLDADLTALAAAGNSSVLAATTASFLTADETKLDGISPGAQVNAVNSVSGKTGTVTLEKADVGLANADNTSDVNKPVSSATQTALDAKLDDTQFSGLSKITVGMVAPSSPSIGDIWIDTN